MKLLLAPFSIIISVLILFVNPIDASTNCDTLYLINGNKLLITEHKFHDNKFHFYICDDELLEEKHIIDRKSIVKIAAFSVPPVKEKKVVKVKKVKKKRIRRKRLKYNAYLKLKNGREVKGRLYSRKSYEVTIKLDGELKRYSFSDLKSLKIQKKNKVLRGITGGVLTGIGLGILQFSGGTKSSSSYFGTFPDFPDQKESIRIAVISTLGATLVTLLIVKAKVEISLNRKNKKRYKFTF